MVKDVDEKTDTRDFKNSMMFDYLLLGGTDSKVRSVAQIPGGLMREVAW
jgi:hypothetical protein